MSDLKPESPETKELSDLRLLITSVVASLSPQITPDGYLSQQRHVWLRELCRILNVAINRLNHPLGQPRYTPLAEIVRQLEPNVGATRHEERITRLSDCAVSVLRHPEATYWRPQLVAELEPLLEAIDRATASATADATASATAGAATETR